MVNFVCVLWDNKHTNHSVKKLYNMIQKNLTIDHKFYCFTDQIKNQTNNDIIFKKFPKNGFKGWWNKLQLFNPEIKLEGVNIFFDLNLIISKNIDHFATYGEDESFCVLPNFNSNIIKWNNKTAYIIWEEYMNNHFSLLHMNHSDDRASIIWEQYGNKSKYFSEHEIIKDIMSSKPEFKFFPESYQYN